VSSDAHKLRRGTCWLLALARRQRPTLPRFYAASAAAIPAAAAAAEKLTIIIN